MRHFQVRRFQGDDIDSNYNKLDPDNSCRFDGVHDERDGRAGDAMHIKVRSFEGIQRKECEYGGHLGKIVFRE